MFLFNTRIPPGVSLTDIIQPTVPGILGISVAGLVKTIAVPVGTAIAQNGVVDAIQKGEMTPEKGKKILTVVACIKRPDLIPKAIEECILKPVPTAPKPATVTAEEKPEEKAVVEEQPKTKKHRRKAGKKCKR